MKNEKALQTGAVVSEATEFVHDGVDELFSYSVMTAGICMKIPIEDR